MEIFKKQMKKATLLIITVLLTFGLHPGISFAACFPGDPGYPMCSNSSTETTEPSKSAYEKCKQSCNNTSSADKSSCLSACETLNPDKTQISDYCKQHQCLGSAADSGNPCCAQNGGGPANPSYTPDVMPTPTPSTGDPSKNESYYGELGGENYVCGGIMSDKLLQLLVKVYRTIGLVLVVGVIILGMVDFTQATSSDDADAMKKAIKRFTNRLIIAILVAILPTILSFILTLFGDPNMKNCLDKINI